MTNGVFGSVHDLKMTRTCGLLFLLLSGEMILADKGYIGETCFIHPFKSPRIEIEKEFNSAISSLCQIVEHTNQKIKIFGFTQQKWRHNLDLHPMAFKVICHALNIEFEFNPVHKE